MIKKILTCIQCPLGCRLKVFGSGEAFEVAGNRCDKGREYAWQECTAPMRSLTSTVRTVFPDFPLLPVKTGGEVPLESLLQVMKVINTVVVEKRLRPGDIVLKSIEGFNIPLVATADMGNNLSRV